MIETVYFLRFQGFRPDIQVGIKIPEPCCGEVHNNRFVWLAVLGVINNRRQLVPRNQENITFLKMVGRIGLYNFGFTGNEPNQHMVIE